MGKGGGLISVQGIHRFVVMGDERPGTPEILDHRIETWDRRIADWKPATAWDTANQRSLQYLKERRTRAAKAADRLTSEATQRAIQERRRTVEHSRQALSSRRRP